MHLSIRILLLFVGLCLTFVTNATDGKRSFENKQLRIRLIPRSPEQIAAFYEARGFNKAMITELSSKCFITIGILNKSREPLWLELENWHFETDSGELKAFNRAYWKSRWQTMGIPLAHQATFRWTLLPERLDFQPDEAEGGNIILPRTQQALHLSARFATGTDKQGKPVVVNIDKLYCARDPSP